LSNTEIERIKLSVLNMTWIILQLSQNLTVWITQADHDV
jgi:hypothetical protein